MIEGANAQKNEVDSVQDGNIKHQLIMSPSTLNMETKLLNLNPKQSKPPFQSGKKGRLPIEQVALGIPMEESFEDDEIQSLPGDQSDLGKAK